MSPRRLIARALLAALLVAATLLTPSQADAFCGFYVGGGGAKLFNNASLVVLLRDGTKTVLSMQNNYQGPPEKFAMVVPVPVVLQKDDVKTLPREVFDRIDQLAAPRLVEYWEENPCPQYYGYGAGYGRSPPMAAMKPTDAGPAERPQPTVTVLAQFVVGEYDIVILGANDSLALDTWLRREGYKIPEGAEPILRPYVEAGMKFFVAKVDVAKVKLTNGQAMLSPLRFHYDAETFSLPVRLGLLNSSGTQDLIVHVLSRGKRYEVANYDNVAVPTNLDVNPGAKTNFAAFYASLFDQTLTKNPGAIVTEYAWEASKCDPCPGPPMNPGDLTLLGGDVTTLKNPFGVVLTRLHARYRKDTSGADLVFKTASPITGGSEGEEPGAHGGSANAFQGRYVLRHAWTGPITCKFPQRGMWGDPPPGVDVSPVTPALKVAFAQRDPKLLPWLLAPLSKSAGLSGGSVLSKAGPTPPPTPIAPGPPASASTSLSAPPTSTTGAPGSETPPPQATGTAQAQPPTGPAAGPPPAPPQGGCAGCAVDDRGVGAEAAAALIGLAYVLRRRRLRRGLPRRTAAERQ
jgi:hypothetical protein